MVSLDLFCHRGIGPIVSGHAMVTNDDFSARYDLDRIQGVFSRPQHELYGQIFIDKILVFNNAKGGVATAWMLKDMMSRGVSPRALLCIRVNPIIAQGAAFADMAICDRFEKGDVTKLIKDGAHLTVYPDRGLVKIKGPD